MTTSIGVAHRTERVTCSATSKTFPFVRVVRCRGVLTTSLRARGDCRVQDGSSGHLCRPLATLQLRLLSQQSGSSEFRRRPPTARNDAPRHARLARNQEPRFHALIVRIAKLRYRNVCIRSLCTLCTVICGICISVPT